MSDIFILDNCVDDREFRNYVATILEADGFKDIDIEDISLWDNNPDNDNNLTAKKGSVKYAIQTYLNKEIDQKDVDKTVKYVKQQAVYDGIIVTNREVSDEIKRYAIIYNVEIWDRPTLVDLVYRYEIRKESLREII